MACNFTNQVSASSVIADAQLMNGRNLFTLQNESLMQIWGAQLFLATSTMMYCSWSTYVTWELVCSGSRLRLCAEIQLRPASQ